MKLKSGKPVFAVWFLLMLFTLSFNSAHIQAAPYDQVMYKSALNAFLAFQDKGQSRMLQKAMLDIESAIAINPSNSEYWYVQGLIYSRLKGDRLSQERSLSSFLRSIELEPEHGRAQMMTGVKLLELGRFDLAVIQYQYIMGKDPSLINGNTLSSLALAYLGADRGTEGIAFLEGLKGEHPDNPDIALVLGVMYRAKGESSNAARVLEQAGAEATGLKKDYARHLLEKEMP